MHSPVAFAAGLLLLPACAIAQIDSAANPNVRNVGRGEGYSIRYVTATPAPGDTLMVGDTVHLRVTVDYALDVRDRAIIGLVLQDPGNRPLVRGHEQVMTLVERGRGRKMLEDRFVVPPGVPRISVFMPLMPEGYGTSNGDLLLYYFVKPRP